MEFKIRKSEVGFKYFLTHQIKRVEWTLELSDSVDVKSEEMVEKTVQAIRLKELFEIFILSLDLEEKDVVDYLMDTSSVFNKIMPKNYYSLYEIVYKKWVNVFFENNVNKVHWIKYKLLGKFLSFYRKEHHLSLSELAEMIGINGSTLSRYENATRKPPIDVVYAICQLLNINIEFLLKQSE